MEILDKLGVVFNGRVRLVINVLVLVLGLRQDLARRVDVVDRGHNLTDLLIIGVFALDLVLEVLL